uniref:Uncharacterized protein n=1 Tax=Timema shepardi TaxID=629360 RepID=A0A7R9ASX4_TIMSH|nr:unnamed protein product [Timema shepardi]
MREMEMSNDSGGEFSKAAMGHRGARINQWIDVVEAKELFKEREVSRITQLRVVVIDIFSRWCSASALGVVQWVARGLKVEGAGLSIYVGDVPSATSMDENQHVHHRSSFDWLASFHHVRQC